MKFILVVLATVFLALLIKIISPKEERDTIINEDDNYDDGDKVLTSKELFRVLNRE